MFELYHQILTANNKRKASTTSHLQSIGLGLVKARL